MKQFDMRTPIGLAGLLCVAALTACGEDGSATPTSAPGDDTASAYEALSASLQACEEQQDACTTAAAGDTTRLMNCDAQAAACKQKTEAAAEHARENLSRDTHACWKRCRHGDDDAGTITSDDDAGTDDMHGCIEHHTPRLPRCVSGLLSCLHDAGLRKGDATRDELVQCIQEADSCFRDEFAARRGRGRGRGDDNGSGQGNGRGDHGAAGTSAAGAAGASAAGTGATGMTPPSAAGAGGSNMGQGHGHDDWNRGGRNRGRR
jgi:hypothetical protein